MPGLVDMAQPPFAEVGIKSARREAFWWLVRSGGRRGGQAMRQGHWRRDFGDLAVDSIFGGVYSAVVHPGLAGVELHFAGGNVE